MAEIMTGGYAVEYICRVTDETGGLESVPESATMAQNNMLGKTSTNIGGSIGAEDASASKTSSALNGSLRIAMPVLNGLTDGVASQVVSTGRQVARIGSALDKGLGAIFGAAVPLITSLVTLLVQKYVSTTASNDAIAEDLDATNRKRQLAGLSKINYTRTGLTGKVRIEEYR